MTIRTKVYEDGVVVRYEVKNDAGIVVGVDEEVKPTAELTNRETLERAARQALATNRTYIGLATPTAAQTTAEVKALARQVNGIIRLVLGLLDGTD